MRKIYVIALVAGLTAVMLTACVRRPGEWRTNLGTRIWPQRVLANDSVAIVIGSSSVVGVETARGKEIWRLSDPRLSLEARGYVNRNTLCLAGGGAQALDAATGAERWQRASAYPVGLTDDAVWALEPFTGSQYDGYYGEKVVLLSAATGEPVHEFSARGVLGCSAQSVAASSLLAVRTVDALYLLAADGSEQRWPLPACSCVSELAITPQGIVCVEYEGFQLAAGDAFAPAGGSMRANVRLLDTLSGLQKWSTSRAHTWELLMRPGVMRANEQYVVLIKYPGITVLDLASGRELFDTPQTGIVSGPQWLALDGEYIYWTGFDATGMTTGLERFHVRRGEHSALSGPGGVQLRDGLAAGGQLILLGDYENLLTGGMNARTYVISLPLASEP